MGFIRALGSTGLASEKMSHPLAGKGQKVVIKGDSFSTTVLVPHTKNSLKGRIMRCIIQCNNSDWIFD